jgi:hypothetical protein
MDLPKFVNAWFLADSTDYKYPELPQVPGETLFVLPNQLPEFVENSLPSIKVPFILITTLSDATIPYDIRKESIKLERNPYLIRWYAMNCVEETKKLKHLPVGLDYANRRDWQVIENVIHQLTSNKTPKLPKIYGNFHFMLATRYGKDREEAIRDIPKHLIDYQELRLSQEDTYKRMSSYKFIASPFGNGFDCHRTWEALVLGCIPIVRSSGLDPMFKGLPVLIVNSWKEITEELLDSFQPDTSAMEKLTLSYWIAQIRKAPHV